MTLFFMRNSANNSIEIFLLRHKPAQKKCDQHLIYGDFRVLVIFRLLENHYMNSLNHR